MTRKYEIVYIFDTTLEEAQVNERLERFHGLLQDDAHPEPVTETNHWGRRTLAYPIRRKEAGYYVVTQFETSPERIPELERVIKLDESVLRHLLVVNEGELPRAPRTDDDDIDSSPEDDDS